MRSFVCSALFIATMLIGQQWATKSANASELRAPSAQTTFVGLPDR